MSDKKKNNELTEFMKSIPEDPMSDEEPAATIIYDAWGNVLEVRETADDETP